MSKYINLTVTIKYVVAVLMLAFMISMPLTQVSADQKSFSDCPVELSCHMCCVFIHDHAIDDCLDFAAAGKEKADCMFEAGILSGLCHEFNCR